MTAMRQPVGFSHSPSGHQRRILIAEDEILIAMDLQGRLESLGYCVPGIASSADMAVEFAATNSPDLILMDIRLQNGSDGIAAAVTIRERPDIPTRVLRGWEQTRARKSKTMRKQFGDFLLRVTKTLRVWTRIWLSLEKSPKDAALTASIFRTFHTIKVTCGFVTRRI